MFDKIVFFFYIIIDDLIEGDISCLVLILKLVFNLEWFYLIE